MPFLLKSDGDLSQISGLSSLTQLCCSGFKANIGPLTYLASLTTLDLNFFPDLSDLAPISGLTALTALDLSQCPNISDLRPLSGLSTLDSLNIKNCREIYDLAPLTVLASLRNLDCSSSSARGLEIFPALTKLDCQECNSMTFFGPLPALVILNCKWCPRLFDLTPLSRSTALTSLNCR